MRVSTKVLKSLSNGTRAGKSFASKELEIGRESLAGTFLLVKTVRLCYSSGGISRVLKAKQYTIEQARSG
jgi:hypothetical protein